MASREYTRQAGCLSLVIAGLLLAGCATGGASSRVASERSASEPSPPRAARCSADDPDRRAWFCVIGQALYSIGASLQPDTTFRSR